MKLWIAKLPNGDLRPLHSNDIKHLRAGSLYQFELKLPRNLKFHRKFFAFLKAVYSIEAIQTDYSSIEHLRYALTMDAGYFYQVQGLNGEIYLKAKSISFAEMEDGDFSQLYNRVLNIVLQRLPAYTKEDIQKLEQEILKFW